MPSLRKDIPPGECADLIMTININRTQDVRQAGLNAERAVAEKLEAKVESLLERCADPDAAEDMVSLLETRAEAVLKSINEANE